MFVAGGGWYLSGRYTLGLSTFDEIFQTSSKKNHFIKCQQPNVFAGILLCSGDWWDWSLNVMPEL